MALDPAWTDISRLDAARIKIKTTENKFSFDPITITDGICKYKVAIYPVVLGEDIKLGVDESKWVDFGVFSDGEVNADHNKLRW